MNTHTESNETHPTGMGGGLSERGRHRPALGERAIQGTAEADERVSGSDQ